jgi:Ion channel
MTIRPRVSRGASARLVAKLSGDATLSALLVVQALTLFVALPLGASHPSGRLLLDASHLAFAALCAVALTRHRAVRAALLVAIALLAAGPLVAGRTGAHLEAIALVAFGFNLLVTVLVTRRVFSPGRVTAYRVQGAVLVYLNAAALFAIAYGLLEAHAPGSIVPNAGGALAAAPGERTATLSYFSLATITTTGYGDLAPSHPLARSLANLEAVFGQLFPATFLARLVGLHITQGARDS